MPSRSSPRSPTTRTHSQQYIKRTYTYPDDPQNGYNPWSESPHHLSQQQLEAKKREEVREEAKLKQLGKPQEGGIMSWLQKAGGSSPVQFAATAIVSGVVVASGILGYQAVRRQEKVEELKKDIPEEGFGESSQVGYFSRALLGGGWDWSV